MWAVDMEGDVASDLSALHRVDNMYDMGSRRWAQLVPRLLAYPGAVQFRFKMKVQQEQEQPGEGGVVGPVDESPVPPPGPWKPDKVVPSTPTALKFSDIGDMFSFA